MTGSARCLRVAHVLVDEASTAMRTAMPFVTCSRMTDCGPSATALSISTPRFIGPGVHHDRVRLGELEPLLRKPVTAEILLRDRECR